MSKVPIRHVKPPLARLRRAIEIIERPASVLRELIDNALDAGATHIRLDAAGGGLRELTVADDGAGIPPDAVARAFGWGTTSRKPSGGRPPLGFRGEALAAIAALSQVVCVTRSAAAEQAVELRVAGGEIQSRAAAERDPGTSITVRNLFCEIPRA